MGTSTYADSMPRAARRAAGAFYTPAWLVDEVTAEALAAPLRRARWADDGAPELRVLDPAAGDGRFLEAVTRVLTDEAIRRGHDAASARRAIVGRVVVGIERDPAAAARARAALGPGADVRVAEALLGGAAADGAWDVVVGNPPYVRGGALKASDPELWRRLRGRFAATSYKEWDLYAAFLEQALAWLAPGGQAGLVAPSRWLTAATAAPLRERLGPSVRKIVDLGSRQVFPGATTYIALVYLARDAAGPVAVVRGPAHGHVPRATLGRAPWALAVGDEGRLLERLRAVGPPLGDVARIAKGTGTNADPVFLLEPRGGELWSPALAASVTVERTVLRPCLRGRDVRPMVATPARLALLPYDDEGRLLPLGALPAGARAYLERCRALLEAREGGRFTGEVFHAWGRPQNLRYHLDRAPKVVCPDAAAEGRAALDADGTLVVDSAYAIRPVAGYPIRSLLGALNSPVVGIWLRALGVPLRGGYFRMKTEYLRSLPVPDPTSAGAALAAAAPDDELVAAVTALYGLPS